MEKKPRYLIAILQMKENKIKLEIEKQKLRFWNFNHIEFIKNHKEKITLKVFFC